MAQSGHSAVVVGSGPNGLAAAITLQRAGVPALVLEARPTVGGGMRTAELTLPGFRHDICSAIHPLAASSAFFQSLSLGDFGLEFIDPPILAAHPFSDRSATVLLRSFDQTVLEMEQDGAAYRNLMEGLRSIWPSIMTDVLGPPVWPSHPLAFARFGMQALMPASFSSRRFPTFRGKAFFAAMAAHSMQPLTKAATSAAALVLLLTGHAGGWPVAKGGSQSIADALSAYFRSLGGVIETGVEVTSLDQLPPAQAILFDLSPRQLLQIAGDKLPSLYRAQLSGFRYGPGVFKMDWALSDPIPFAAEACRRAGTVHLGGSFEEIALSEQEANDGRISERPFVLLAQQSRFDASRAPGGKETAWAYCHVPNGSPVDMSEVIERQIERFAPGFRECILERHAMGPAAIERYNANYNGGDINGGAMNFVQMFARPAARLSPYKTPLRGVYLCSASTPPGGGVHGLCGYYAARQALHDCFPGAE